MDYMITVTIQIPIEADSEDDYIEKRDTILGELEEKYSMYVDVVSEDCEDDDGDG